MHAALAQTLKLSAIFPMSALHHPAIFNNQISDDIMWIQKEFHLTARPRGFHLITNEILQKLPELASYKIGLLNILLKHTSASITINENTDPAVRKDFESFFNRAVPEDEPYYLHNDEGSDDLPAHLKASIFGATLNIPITNGQMNMGIWQGIYLCEHRNHGGSRTIIATLQGEIF